MKKTTVQDIADAIGISRVTVWKVFSGKSGVSESLSKRVLQTAVELGYDVPSELMPQSEANYSSPLTISLAVSRPETSSFWMNTIHEIARVAAASNINLSYTYLPSDPDDSYELPPMLNNRQTQGIIVLNVYNPSIIRKINALNIPTVFMDTCSNIPFEKLNGDLLLIEGRSPIAEITEQILSTGAKKIGFIGDINYAQTNFERYYGFKDTMRAHNLPIENKWCLISSIEADSYKEVIDEFIGGLKEYPEAFICVSDFVANLVCNALNARGKKVPDDVMVSGFGCVADLQTSVPLTSVRVNNKDVGTSLANKLLHRINYPDASRELSYIFPTVVYNRSTKR